MDMGALGKMHNCRLESIVCSEQQQDAESFPPLSSVLASYNLLRLAFAQESLVRSIGWWGGRRVGVARRAKGAGAGRAQVRP